MKWRRTFGWLAIIAGGAAAAAAQDNVGAAATAVTITAAPRGGVRMAVVRKATYLGVATSPAPEALADQLKLPKGVGLLVDFVDAKSPAAAAGLRKTDVLMKLDDQLLVNPAQLLVLVRMRKPKDKVALTLVRETEEQKVAAELGESEETTGEIRADCIEWRAATASTSSFSDGEHTLTLTTTDGQKHLMVMDRAGNLVFNGPVNTPAQRKEAPPDVLKKLETMEGSMRLDVQGGGVAHGIAVMNAGAGGTGMNLLQGPGGVMIPFRAVGQPSGESRSWTDPEHCLTVTTRQTGRYLTVDDKNGKILWEGPIQTDEQRKAVPPEFLPKLEKLEAKVREESRGTVSLIEDGMTVTLTTESGKQSVAAKNADGNVIFDGPVDTEDQRAKMPEKVRAKVEKLWKTCASVWQSAQENP
jgi:hypothetical protein